MKFLLVLTIFSLTVYSQIQVTDSLSGRNENGFMRSILLHEITITGNRNNSPDCTCDDAKNTESLLGSTEGIDLIRRGNFAQEAIIHGFSGEQISLTIDGMHLFGACTDKMDPATAYVEKNNLQKINYSSRSSDFSKGQNIGGSLDLITTKPDFGTPLSFTVSTGIESAALLKKSEAAVNYSGHKFALKASYSFKHASDYLAGNTTRIDNSGFRKNNVKFDFSYRPVESGLLTFSYIGDFARDVGYPAMIMDANETRANLFNLSFTLDSLKILAGNAQLKMSVYNNSVLHWMDDYSRSTDEINHRIVMPGMYMPMFGRTNTIGSNALLNINYGPDIIQAGYDIYRVRAFADMNMFSFTPGTAPMYLYNLGEVASVTSTLHGKYIHLFTESFSTSFTTGITYAEKELQNRDARSMLEIYTQKTAGSNSNVMGSFACSAQYAFSPHLLANASVSHSMRNPSHSETYGYFLYNLADNAIYIGNPEIKSERSTQFALGMEYLPNNTRVKTSIFITTVSDYIAGVVTQTEDPANRLFPQAIKMYSNIGNAQVLGFECSMLTRIHNLVTLSGNISYTRGKAISLNDDLPMITPLKGIAGITWGAQDYIGLEVQFESKQSNPSRIIAHETVSPGYCILNVRSGFSLTDFLLIQGGIENIFDKNYYRHVSVSHLPDMGRNFYLNIGITAANFN